MSKVNRGFSSMDPVRQKQIASLGGKRAHEIGKAHEFTSEKAKIAGSKGGRKVSQDRKHMAEIGRMGGLKRRQNMQALLLKDTNDLIKSEGVIQQTPHDLIADEQ